LDTKQCTRCRETKTLSHFSHDNRRNRAGLKSWCKQCCAGYIAQNKMRHADYTKISRMKYRSEWLAFFESVYGEDPICQVCGTDLAWYSDHRADGRYVVNFDHRHGGEASIKGPPASWWGSHACTLENQKTWLECDFGILCGRCNSCLPTMGRGEWLQKALRYYGYSETSSYN